MENINSLGSRKEKVIAFSLFTFLWIYLWLRAALIPFSHDEIATFFQYVHSERFIPFVNAEWYANNHVLNTVLTLFFYKIFGATELVLRLPNLLFFSVFFFFCYKLSQEIKNRRWRWLFVIVLCFAHYFLEFFALCRGYGIAMASLTASIYYLMQAIKTNSAKQYLLCLLFAVMASMANLTLINSTVIIIFLLAVNTVYSFKQTTLKKSLLNFASILLVGFVPLVLLAIFALELQKRGLLIVGTHEGFWKVTMLSITKVFTGSDSVFIAYYVALLFVISCLFFSALFLKQKSLQFFFNARFVFFYLLVGNLFITLFLGNSFSINYPEDRAAMYLFPLMAGSFCFLADDVADTFNSKFIMPIAAPMLLLSVHFFFNMNLTYSSFWKELHIPYRFYDNVQQYAVQGQSSPTISGYKMRRLTWAFMNYKRGNGLNLVYSTDYPNVNADFQLAMMKDRTDWLQDYDSLDYDPYSEIWLLKKKEPVKLNFIFQSPVDLNAERTNNEYWNFYDGSVDSLSGKTLLLTVDMSFTSYTKPYVGRVVVSVEDKNHETLRYEYVQLDYFRNEWKGEPHNFHQNIIIHTLPAEADRMVVYFWNILGMEYSIKDATCKIEEMN